MECPRRTAPLFFFFFFFFSFVRFQLRRSFISETDFCVKIRFSNFLQWQQRAHCKLLYTGSRVLNVLVISIPSPYRQIFSDFRGTHVIVLSKTRGLEQMPDSRFEPELWGVSQLAGRATINYSRQSPCFSNNPRGFRKKMHMWCGPDLYP